MLNLLHLSLYTYLANFKDVHDSGSSPGTGRYDPWEYLPVFWPASPGTCFPRVAAGHRSLCWDFHKPAGNLPDLLACK